ncbi:MAG: helix-turn-helix domain-containing protein [Stackebrandtia sp.]
MNANQISPTVALRLIASELKRLRDQKGVSRAEVEDAIELRRNALYRYENCESPMQLPIARAIFEHLGQEGEMLETMLNLVRASRDKTQRGMAKGLPHAGEIPPWFEDFVILERDASEINVLALTLIPGRLQTEEYARAVLQAGVLGKDVEDHVRIRMERAEILDSDSHPRYWAIVNEAVLRRLVGGKRVMKAQLEHLATMAQRPGITVQILPEAAGAHISMTASFELLKFDVAPQCGVAYLEYLTGAIYRDAPEETAVFADGYRHLMSAAASERESLRIIDRTIKDLYS